LFLLLVGQVGLKADKQTPAGGFCADVEGGKDIYSMRGIDRPAGCMVVARPDQYVAQVLPLDAFRDLASYFDGFMPPQSVRGTSSAAAN
jgi:phenol 2-monooxygenase